MALFFVCKSCQERLKVTTLDRPKKITCPKCRQNLLISPRTQADNGPVPLTPFSHPEPAADFSRFYPSLPSDLGSQSNRSKGLKKLLVPLLVVVSLVFVSLMGYFFFITTDPPTEGKQASLNGLVIPQPAPKITPLPKTPKENAPGSAKEKQDELAKEMEKLRQERDLQVKELEKLRHQRDLQAKKLEELRNQREIQEKILATKKEEDEKTKAAEEKRQAMLNEKMKKETGKFFQALEMKRKEEESIRQKEWRQMLSKQAFGRLMTIYESAGSQRRWDLYNAQVVLGQIYRRHEMGLPNTGWRIPGNVIRDIQYIIQVAGDTIPETNTCGQTYREVWELFLLANGF